MLRAALLTILAALCASGQTLVIRAAVGLTRNQVRIEALTTSAGLDYQTKKTRVLLIGGLDGNASVAERVEAAFKSILASEPGGMVVSAIPMANPGNVDLGPFPPTGEAYTANPEAMYLWRWIGIHAPDCVLIVGDDKGLISALEQNAPAATGVIPAARLENTSNLIKAIPGAIKKLKAREPSPARVAIQSRLERPALEVARELAKHYGQELNEVVYIPAVALIGRLRLDEVEAVERIVKPYYDGKPTLEKATSSHLPGHLVFGELANLTKKKRYVELTRAAADLGFDPQGNPKESMPMHNEMSDSVFMGCPILARAGRLTGERKYFDMAVRHMRFMLKLNLRADGLHRHSPLDEAAWGRGNGFPALGLALTLADFPIEHPDRIEILTAFRKHMEALARFQDETGMWRQVIDLPGSYRELTATCMIAFSMLRGVREGWLSRGKYETLVERAWEAVKSRIAPDGSLVDVCTGTGKQKSLKDYLDRPAILGRDPRGGAMALLFATEVAHRPR